MRPITDTFGRPLASLRVSVTDRCNLRCQYCMPAAIVYVCIRILLRDYGSDRLLIAVTNPGLRVEEGMTVEFDVLGGRLYLFDPDGRRVG